MTTIWPAERRALKRVTRVLVKLLPDNVMADVINCTLGSDCDPNLTDDEAEFAGELHEFLCTQCTAEALQMATIH